MQALNGGYELCLRTNDLRKDELDGTRRRKSVEIFPLSGEPWNFVDVCILLNLLLRDWKKEKRTPRIYKVEPETNNIIALYTFIHPDDWRYKIRIHVNTKTKEINVNATVEWLKDCWIKETFNRRTNIGSQGRNTHTQKEFEMTRFKLLRDVRERTTLALILNKSMKFYTRKMFSVPFDLFASTVIHFCLDYSNLSALQNYYTEFFVEKRKKKYENSQTKFMREVEGYLKFRITYNASKDFDSIIIDENEVFVIDGVYISPYAKSILKDNAALVDGMMLDTTWKLMQNYVTSILVASVCNVSVPLGFSFGKAETKEQYQLLFSFFNSKLDIDLSEYVFESDQGSSLRGVCADNNCAHLACLRHLLVSLKCDEFGYDAGRLVKAKSIRDLDTVMNELSNHYSQITEIEKQEKITKKLSKIGLGFIDGKIEIISPERWNEVSQLERVKFKMPSTTNALEAFHGHLNEDIPRRNEFWSSLYRTITALMNKTFRFKESLIHNFNNTKRRVKNHYDSIIRLHQMDAQIRFYSTTKESCECGDTSLESAMFRCDIPCCHQFHLVQSFPSLPEFIQLKIDGSIDKLDFEYEGKNVTVHSILADEEEKHVFQAVQTIKRFSHYKNKNEIIEFVRNTIEHTNEFVFGQSLGLLKTICAGIRFFGEKRKKKAVSVGSDESTTDVSADSTESSDIVE